MRGLTLPAAVATLTIALAAPAGAQAPTTPPATPPAASAAASAPDAVVARVGGDAIRASELAEAAQGLPEELRAMPPNMLYPMLLDQLVDRHAIVLAARKQGLEKDPTVVKAIARATDTAMQNALLSREIVPTLTPDAIKARYDRDIANKPGEEEAHAQHILVADEDKAKDIIKQLKAGADFEKLARENSTDPSAKGNGGDLGFFKKNDMLPEFSNAAFTLQPGAITDAPVKTRFGWHVIKLLEKRTAPPPPLDQVREEIRQSLIQEGVTKVLAEAKTGLAIEKFNQDGTPMTDAPAAATPGPAPAPAK